MDASTTALLEDAAWLRRLARHLVSSPSEAEDVAQETWLAAVRARSSPSRGWLHVVARRAASKVQRATRRRSDAEALASVAEDESPSGEVVVERLEVARRVADALKGLPDPFRKTLYMLYYEGIEPNAIARHEGIPAGTVRWRAHRGRELMREALIRDGRTWEHWSAMLAPIAGIGSSPATAGSVPWLGGIAMSVKWTLAGAVVGAVVAGGTWLASESRPATPRPLPQMAVDDQSSEDPHRDTTDLGDTAPDRSNRVAADPVATPSDPDFGVIGLGRIADGMGIPVLEAKAVFEDSEARRLTANSGPEGTWSLLGLEPGVHSLTVTAAGYVSHAERIEVPDRGSWRHDIVLQRGRQIPVRFEDSEGEPLVADRAYRGVLALLSVVATGERPAPQLVGVRTRLVYQYGVGRFDPRIEEATPSDLDPRYQGILHINDAGPVWVSVVYRDVVLESRPFAGNEDELVFVLDEEAIRATHGQVVVRIEDHLGQAIFEGVRLTHPQGGVRVSGEAEGDRLVFSDVPPGLMKLRCNDRTSEYERLSRSVTVPPGGLVDLGTIRLDPRAKFRVQLFDQTRIPLATGLSAICPDLVADRLDLSQDIFANCDADGWAEFADLGPGLTLLRAGGNDGFARVARLVDTREQSSFELVVPSGVEVVFAGPQSQGEGYVLENAEGLPLYAGSRMRRSVYLAPASYTLVRWLEGTEVERLPFRVGTKRTVVRWDAQ